MCGKLVEFSIHFHTFSVFLFSVIFSCFVIGVSASYVPVSLANASITDLTGYTVTVPANWTVPAGYGFFDLYGTIFGFDFTSISVGYSGGVFAQSDYIEFITTGGQYRSFNGSDSLVFNISGGVDASNSSLIQWLYNNNATFENGGSSSQITDLTGYTWTANSTPVLSDLEYPTDSSYGYSVDFVSNGLIFDRFGLADYNGDLLLRYSSITSSFYGYNVYDSRDSSWLDLSYKTVVFEGGVDVTNSDLIEWLLDNGSLTLTGVTALTVGDYWVYPSTSSSSLDPSFIGSGNTIIYFVEGYLASRYDASILSFSYLELTLSTYENSSVWSVVVSVSSDVDNVGSSVPIIRLVKTGSVLEIHNLSDYNRLFLEEDLIVGTGVEADFLREIFKSYADVPPVIDNPFIYLFESVIEALDVNIFGSFSIWDILSSLLGLYICGWLLKMLAGG